jgi:hypothetical protein
MMKRESVNRVRYPRGLPQIGMTISSTALASRLLMSQSVSSDLFCFARVNRYDSHIQHCRETPSIHSLANYSSHVIVNLPAHRYGAPWSGASREAAAEACCLLLQASHAATNAYAVYRARLLKLAFIVHMRLSSATVKARTHSITAPSRPSLDPLSAPFIPRAGPLRLVSVLFCDDPLLCNVGIASRQHAPVTCIGTSLVFRSCILRHALRDGLRILLLHA